MTRRSGFSRRSASGACFDGASASSSPVCPAPHRPCGERLRPARRSAGASLRARSIQPRRVSDSGRTGHIPTTRGMQREIGVEIASQRRVVAEVDRLLHRVPEPEPVELERICPSERVPDSRLHSPVIRALERAVVEGHPVVDLVGPSARSAARSSQYSAFRAAPRARRPPRPRRDRRPRALTQPGNGGRGSGVLVARPGERLHPLGQRGVQLSRRLAFGRTRRRPHA